MGRWGGGGHPAASACSLRLNEVEEVAVQGAEAEARARARAGAGAGAEGGAEAEDAEEAEARARDSALAKRALVEMEEAAYRYLAQGLQQVLAQLPAQKTAAELMTRRVFCVGPEMTMEEARRLMLKVNKKSTPVVDAEGKFEGTLKYNAVVKALKAGKAAQMVKAWMRREGVTVAPDTPFDDLERVMESEVRPLDACTPPLPKAYLQPTYRLPTGLLPPTYCLPTAYLPPAYSPRRVRGGCRWSLTRGSCSASSRAPTCSRSASCTRASGARGRGADEEGRTRGNRPRTVRLATARRATRTGRVGANRGTGSYIARRVQGSLVRGALRMGA